MGTQWSFKPNDTYKSARELIHLLADVVAKGGNLLLNVGPQPDGQLPAEAVSRLEEIGEWMRVNGEAIHGSRPVAPFREGRVAFTSRDNTVYAIYLSPDGTLPQRLPLPHFRPAAGAHVRLLGSRVPVEWNRDGTGSVITAGPVSTTAPAFVFVFET